MERLVLALVAVLAFAIAPAAEAQERAGVVTTLEGKVTVMRASLSEPAPLKFKDDIFVKDRIATAQDSVARILLGGRAVVTVRERSVVTITEVPGLSTVDVVAGRAAVAVAREKMRPGDLVEVKTPNAVAGIRGTVIVAEVLDASHSVITVLKGVIDVRRLDGGHVVGQATVVNALQRVAVVADSPVPAPQAVAPDAAKRLGQEFRLGPPRSTPPAVTAALNEAEVDRATRHFSAVAAPTVSDRRGSRAADGDEDDDVVDALRRDRDGKSDRAEKAEKIDKADRSAKPGRERGGDRSGSAVTAVKTGGVSAAAAISNLGETLKSNDRGGRKSKDRDR
jgi:hypothetical protein